MVETPERARTPAPTPLLLPAGPHHGRTPGAVALTTPGSLALVDAGMDAEAAEETLNQAWRTTGTRLHAVVWTGPDQGLGERVPEHVAHIRAEEAGSGRPVPGTSARAYRIGTAAAVVWDPVERLLVAGELLAAGAPLLVHITPHQAAAALARLDALPVHTAIGAYGAVYAGGEVRRALRSRIVYVETLERLARAGTTSCTSPRQAAALAWQRGTLAAWSAASPWRHLVNVHAAFAAVAGRPLNTAVAWADARSAGLLPR